MSNTALFLFIRDPKQEAHIKPLAGSASLKQNRRVIETLNEQVLHSIRATGLPYFIITDKDQEGETFGEKFSNAFEAIFNKGYDRVIALGNDHPGLKSGTILEAAVTLKKRPHVVGPAKDGGLYLVGIQKTNFTPIAFQNLPWQTPDLCNTYHQLAHERGERIVTLHELKDADCAYQFITLLNNLKGQLSGNPFFQKLISLIGWHSFFVNIQLPFISSPQLLATCSMRGPPSDHS